MAKGSFNGVITGKKGNTVYYRIANSNNAEKQGWREYNAKVSNPQTDGQIDQRVKLAAVNNLYRALKPIIQRGWENHKYGDESRRAFLKKALGASFEGPYLEKGSTLAVPIKNVPIIYGSLPPVQMVCDDGEIWFMNVIVPSGATTATVGDISRLFIGSDLALEGDQVTLVLGYITELGMVSYRTISFFVGPSDEVAHTTLGVGFGSDLFEGVSRLVIDDIPGSVFSIENCCVLCSISRDGDGSHLRSYAEFTMSETFENYFYGNAATKKAAAKASYIKTSSANTNWQQVPGGGGYTPVVQSAYTRAGVEFTPVGIRVVDPGQNQYLCIYDGEGNNYYIQSYESSSSSLHVYLTGTGATTTAQPTGMTTANSCDVYDTNNVAAGLRAWLIAKGVSPTVLPVRS